MSIRRLPSLYLVLSFACLAIFIVSLALGRYSVPPWTVCRIIVGRILPLPQDWPAAAAIVVLRVRLPRVVAAAAIGAALAAAGAAYQGLFRNPLVSPDVLGVSAGSGFGAALGIFAGLGSLLVAAASFVGGVLCVLLVGLFAWGQRGERSLALVLSGIVAGSLFSSGTSFLKLIADPQNVLPAITYWLMGSLSGIKTADVLVAAPLLAAALILLWLLGWQLNLLTLGEDEARTLGSNVTLARAVVIAAATLATAVCVAVSGLIGWVGLIVPHLARKLAGSDYRRLLPAAMLIGAAFLMVVDDVARLLSTAEIPLGILTSFIGAPFFLYLMRRERSLA
ncbi:MAG: ABC transporter permease [Spirochaetes bacterium GWD1_61_31]|nr:MAG: ABC transporter permease [Spirochaetes bacterium GWB1_60_80]OHD38619.1 MAG: ABC transporter permease [Spirochaetes bacterium GWD1_61_31]OHD43163.1 MAG: ABC transporter permease [Spirochaetes bacterium GWE1_60_18]OHD58738.1 MAG: ABC transporter permease [Spirochaetes bacterium GWF1_60_12]HAP43482.1 ABC transporter permease [Spirochaetaceae bacterium]